MTSASANAVRSEAMRRPVRIIELPSAPTIAIPEVSGLRPVVAIGNFDGVHRGHQVVLHQARSVADGMGRPAALLTFEPHPITFFRPELPFFRLTDTTAKAAVAASCGVDATLILPFDAAMASMSAELFLDGVLGRALGVAGVVVGYDFHFGHGRRGDPAMLAGWGREAGIPVSVVAPVGADARPFSSTAVRQSLSAGDVERAAALLGRAWSVSGIVRHGEKIGRTLGFPTANLALDPACGLRHGIYAVRVEADGKVHDGVASFGRRPTFDNGAPLLETFLFDFSGDLYGRVITVSFLAWLRPELKFDGADALVAQMRQDVEAARSALARSRN